MESKVGFFFVAQVSPRKSLAQKTPKAGNESNLLTIYFPKIVVVLGGICLAAPVVS